MNFLSTIERVRGRIRTETGLHRLRAEWKRMAAESTPTRERTRPRKLLVLSGDPRTLAGSRGDEAMIHGAVQSLRAEEADLQVAVVTSSDEGSAAARDMGFEPLQIWEPTAALETTLGIIDKYRPDAAIVVGGDVMDGYYNPGTTTRLLAIADLLSRRGVKTNILGFSFNERPHRAMKPAYRQVGTALTLNVRDPISYGRFQGFTATPAQLVADAAFMLAPHADTHGVAEVAAWVEGRRQAGDVVLGFNLHPMLIKRPTQAQLDGLVEAATQVLRNVSMQRPVSWVLLSHDYRGSHGDDVCLAPLAAALARSSVGERIHHVRGEKSASELKALAGLMDGVLTGRMHLAIASLGMGVPVAALTYQDKFEGLFCHFDLPRWLLMTPAQASQPEHLERVVNRFLDELDNLRVEVAKQLPKVKEASRRNLVGLL